MAHRKFLGLLSLLLSLGFGGCLIGLMVQTCVGPVKDWPFAGYFGFAVPMLLAGILTGMMWSRTNWLAAYGWAVILAGVVLGVALLYTVGHYVWAGPSLQERKQAADLYFSQAELAAQESRHPSATERRTPIEAWESKRLWNFIGVWIGLGVPMLICGATGVKILDEFEG